MSYYFDVYGPFNIYSTNNSYISKQSDFWKEVENNRYTPNGGLSLAIGCYMFCIERRKAIIPWYIGMTVAKNGFKQEIFTDHKIEIYSDILKIRSGRPMMFLFPLLTRDKRLFSKAYSSGRRPIAWLEKILMGFAYKKNPEIANQRDMHFLKNTTVRGVFGEKDKGRPYAEVTKVRAALFGRGYSK